MTRLYPTAVFAAFSTLLVAIAAANDSQNSVRIRIAPGGLVNIVNNSGSVTLHPGSGQQVVVNATKHSDKIEVDSNGMPDGRRVEIRTHVISQQRLSTDEAKVEYDITVPPGVSVTVSTATAPITVENLNSDLSLSSDTGRITIKNVANAHIRVRSILGRFLEHSRILSFRNGGDSEVWIGSADMMHRNLDRRVEAMVRIKDKAVCDELRALLDLATSDDISCWLLGEDGTWTRRTSGANGPLEDYQEVLIRRHGQRATDARADARAS